MKPTAWLLRPKVQRHPDQPLTRGCYTAEPTQEQRECADLDGDEYMPLFEQPSARLEVAQRLADALAELRRWYGPPMADRPWPGHKTWTSPRHACVAADETMAEWERTK